MFNAHQTSPSRSVQRVHQILNLEVNHIMKDGYDHFMQKEIHEQPETLARTMQGRIAFDQSAQVRTSSCCFNPSSIPSSTEALSPLSHSCHLVRYVSSCPSRINSLLRPGCPLTWHGYYCICLRQRADMKLTAQISKLDVCIGFYMSICQ